MKLKTFFLIFIISSFINHISAQKEFHFKKYNHEKINVRSDVPFSLAKIELDIKKKGKVKVTMEGVCESTFGDIITFGVSNGMWWFPDYGNVGVQVFDTLQRQNRYFHTMSFDVSPEKHTFSAFAHNWTDRSGTGIITVRGNLIIEFIPEEEQELHVYKNISQYPFVINKDKSIIDTLSITTTKPSKALLTFNGRFYSKPDTEVLVILNNKPTMENGLDSLILSTHDINRYPEFSIKFLKDLNIGNNQFYVMARKLKGEFSSSENAFYSTFTATVFYNQNQYDQVFLQKKNTITVADKKSNPVGSVNINIPSKGKLLVAISGFIDLKKNQTVNIGLDIKTQKTRYLDSIKILSKHPGDNKTFFTINQIYDITAGPVQVDLNSSALGTSFQNVIQSDLLVKYLGDNVVSSSQETLYLNEDIFVYPNPTNGIINLSNEKDWIINLLDVNGNQIKLTMSSVKNQFDISDLKNGKYFLKIHEGSGFKIIPFIKAN